MQDTIYISGLEPLIAPEKVASWPLAPGWYLVAGLLLFVFILLISLRIRRRRENRYRSIALKQLGELRKLAADKPVLGDIQDLNRLLKETALSVYPREEVAALYGDEWLGFLDQSCNLTNFTGSSGKFLGITAYLNNEKVNIQKDQWNQVLVESETWIKTHIKPKQ